MDQSSETTTTAILRVPESERLYELRDGETEEFVAGIGPDPDEFDIEPPNEIPESTVRSILFNLDNTEHHEYTQLIVEHPDGQVDELPVATRTENVECSECGELLIGATEQEAAAFLFSHDCDDAKIESEVIHDPLEEIYGE